MPRGGKFVYIHQKQTPSLTVQRATGCVSPGADGQVAQRDGSAHRMCVLVPSGPVQALLHRVE